MLPLLVASPAFAQRSPQDIASARQLYNDGEALRDKGDLKGALEKFKAAHALGDTPITGLELCKTHRALNQPVEAREACLSVGRIGPIKEESQRSKDARTESAKIAEEEKPKIGSIKLKITGVPAGFTPTVQIDGNDIPAVALSAARPVDPGSHIVSARVGNGAETKQSVDTKEGENKEVEVAVQPPPPDEKPQPVVGPAGTTNQPPPPEQHKSSFPTVMYIIGGAGVLIGTVGGIVAISDKGDLKDSCTNNICGRTDWDKLDSARTWGTVSTVSFVLGGAALVIGLIGQLASSSSSTGSTPPPSKLGLGLGGLNGSF